MPSEHVVQVATHLSEGETHLTVRAETESAHSDHRLRVVVMFDRDKYPVFPQLTYDIDVSVSDLVFLLCLHLSLLFFSFSYFAII